MTCYPFRSGRPLANRCSAGLMLLLALAASASAGDFSVTNLVSNNLADNPGQIQDPNLVNPWGISQAGPTGPFWVSDNGTGVSTLYSVSAANDTTTKLGLTVTIPGAGNVTGQDFNTAAASGAFHGDSFLFVSEDGTVSGWRGRWEPPRKLWWRVQRRMTTRGRRS